MRALLKKELRLYLSSLTGLMVIALFLTLNGLVLFVFPSSFNILDYGFATLEPFFALVPFIFLFLLPAVSMRSFAEERKLGTMEALLSRPLSNRQIVWGKYAAILSILAISMAACIVYLWAISSLANPVGNVDMAAFWGAYIGLFLLGAVFAAIGIYISSQTENQIVAFVLSSALCAFIYMGFDLLASMGIFGKYDIWVSYLGIQAHYVSLSRGVLDIRDVVYCLSVIALFLWATELSMHGRQKKGIRPFFWGFLVLVLLNIAMSFLYLRLDLTADKRYTLRNVSKQILKEANEPVYIKVYLAGDLPSGFVRLENATKELLEEFALYQRNLRFEFVDLYKIEDEQLRTNLMRELVEKGMQATQLEVKTKDGLNRRMIFPCAEVSLGSKFVAVRLLQEQYSKSADETLNQSVENLELQFISAIRTLFEKERKSIAILEGHGELSAEQSMSLAYDLTEFYQVKRINFQGEASVLLAVDSISGQISPRYDLLMIARPQKTFDEASKYILDQYVMRGGRIIWFLDMCNTGLDSLRQQEQAAAILYPLNLEDMLFNYGVRLHRNIILDMEGAGVPVVTAYMGGQPVTDFYPLYYCPLLNPLNVLPLHPICKNLGIVKSEFVSGMDTIENTIQKTILLQTSLYSKRVSIPTVVSLEILKEQPSPALFKDGPQNVAILLEGDFTSAYRKRIPTDAAFEDYPFVEKGKDGKMIVVSDGDIPKNDLHYSQGYPMPLGFDQYSKQVYDNKSFVVNAVHYLQDQNQWMELGVREVKLRMLDKVRLQKERKKWQVITVVLPNVLVLVCGCVLYFYRRKKYGLRFSEK